MIDAEFILDTHTLAVLLLVSRIICVFLILAVLLRQLINIKHLHTEYPAVRMTILILTAILLAGQFVPIALDGSAAFTEFGDGQVSTILAAYTINNVLKDMAVGVLLTFLYFRPNATKPPEKPVIDK